MEEGRETAGSQARFDRRQAGGEEVVERTASPGATRRLALFYAREGDMTLLSQRDMGSMWERVMRRAGVRMCFSGGFNPRPRFSFPPAIPVGVGSICEVLIVQVEDDRSEDSIAALVGDELPRGIRLLSLREAPGVSLGGCTASWFEVCPCNGIKREWKDVKIDRKGEEYPLSAFVERLYVQGGRLYFRLLHGGKSVSPLDVVECLGLSAADVDVRRIRMEMNGW